VTRRRTKGDGGITQRHDHPTCPPIADGIRPEHRCRGRWQATLDVVVDGRRRRKTIYARTKAEAQTKLNKALRERDAGALVLKSMTVEAWLGRWLDRKAKPPNALKPQTMRSYRSKVDQYVIPHLGRHQLTALRAAHIEAMYDHMRSAGLAEATLRQTHAILAGALRDAVRADHLSYNPIDKTTPPGTDKAQREQFTVDWQHVDLERGTLTIAQTLQTAEDGSLFLGEPKTARSKRLLPLDGRIETRLRLLWDELGRPNAGLVFPGRDGKPRQPKRDWQDWRDLIDRATVIPYAPLPAIALHAARNTAASLMEASGISDRHVMQILGQSQVATTHRYQTADVERTREAFDSAGRLLELD
jgi:integrase